MFNIFLDNSSPNVRSSEVVRYKRCTVDSDFHSLYEVSRIPYISFFNSFKKLIYREGTRPCGLCIREGRKGKNGASAILVCRNIIDGSVVFPLFIFICWGVDISNIEDLPSMVTVEGYIYKIHGCVFLQQAM